VTKAGLPASYFRDRSGEACGNQFWGKIAKFR
jgi:hypothetical protein